MNFEQALRAELVTVAGLTSKVFPAFAPEGTTTPFVIYSKSNTDYIKTLDGTSTTRIGRYQIDLLAQTYSSLQDFLILVKDKLIGFEGRAIGTGGPFVQSVIVDDVVENFEQKVMFYHATFEIRFYYEGS